MYRTARALRLSKQSLAAPFLPPPTDEVRAVWHKQEDNHKMCRGCVTSGAPRACFRREVHAHRSPFAHSAHYGQHLRNLLFRNAFLGCVFQPV